MYIPGNFNPFKFITDTSFYVRKISIFLISNKRLVSADLINYLFKNNFLGKKEEILSTF